MLKGIKSPPLNGSKSELLKWRSKIIIVIHPANTGKLINNKKDVINIVQGNNGINNALFNIERHEAFNAVIIKLIEPNKLLRPAKCSEKNIKSMLLLFNVDKGT